MGSVRTIQQQFVQGKSQITLKDRAARALYASKWKGCRRLQKLGRESQSQTSGKKTNETHREWTNGEKHAVRGPARLCLGRPLYKYEMESQIGTGKNSGKRKNKSIRLPLEFVSYKAVCLSFSVCER